MYIGIMRAKPHCGLCPRCPIFCTSRPLSSRVGSIFACGENLHPKAALAGRLSLDKLVLFGRVYNRKAAAASSFFCGGYIVKQGFVSAAAYVRIEVVRVLCCNKQI